MPLIECPDCGRKVSDRATTCPDCASPVAEIVAEQRALEVRQRVLESRTALEREVDCPRCSARGYYQEDDNLMTWCVVCEHSGRVTLCEASDGFYAVSRYATERFVAGELHPETSGVVFRIGKQAPTAFRYPKAGERHSIDEDLIPWEIE